MNLPRYNEDYDFDGKKLWLVQDAAHPVCLAITIDASASFPIQRGTLMGKVTSTGKYVPYDDAASDGSEVAVGILNQHVDGLRISATNQDVMGSIGVHGVVIESACVGLDAAAKDDLKGAIIFR